MADRRAQTDPNRAPPGKDPPRGLARRHLVGALAVGAAVAATPARAAA